MTDRAIQYLSAPADVRMGNHWYSIVSLDHFWIERRFAVLRSMAGMELRAAREIAEVGCGSGVLQKQIEDALGREVAGFELNDVALRQNVSTRSPLFCYDIHDRRPELLGRFDVILLFDVLEHIDDDRAFLRAIGAHLAPGGTLVISVPAGRWAWSAYDVVSGHVRRYDPAMLHAAAADANFSLPRWTYWGMPFAPGVFIRKLMLAGSNDTNQIIEQGFDVKSRVVNNVMKRLGALERVPQHLLGTSIMAICRAGA